MTGINGGSEKRDLGFARGDGLLVIEVRNSNPNGDPDREGDPRQRDHSGKGEISGVSIKRKMRTLIGDKEGDVWCGLQGERDSADYDILGDQGHNAEIERLIKENPEGFKRRFWDARIFGNTYLEQGMDNITRTGAIQINNGFSVAPVRIERSTQTNKTGVQADKDRGMAPLGRRVVEHGVYTAPFSINPNDARKTGCTKEDIALALKVLPFVYSHNQSSIRVEVFLRHVWYAEHTSLLNSFNPWEMWDALTPVKLKDPMEPSTSWEDYEVPNKLPETIREKCKGGKLYDLCSELPHWVE